MENSTKYIVKEIGNHFYTGYMIKDYDNGGMTFEACNRFSTEKKAKNALKKLG